MSDSQLIFTKDLSASTESRRRHARAVLSGEEVRVARGVYANGVEFERLGERARYLLRVRAIAETRGNRPVLSHWSAAAIHGLPIVGKWPVAVHITQPPVSGLRSASGVVRHSVPLTSLEITEIDGILLTGVARTVVDLAASASTISAVATADAALHIDRFDNTTPLATREQLHGVWRTRHPFRGHARALDVIHFAATGAASPLESVSRVNMRVVGCPPPALQIPQFDSDGFIGETDFFWEEYNLLAESDGDRKYLDAAFRSGRTVEQVMLDEKIREDRMRSIPRGFVRWRWRTALDPRSLERVLRSAGLPTRRSDRWSSE